MPVSYNIPNILTFLRIALIPIIVIIFYLPYPAKQYYCAAVFCIAGITDFLDGMLARKLGQTTRFGAFIDPVADKLMVVISLVLFIEQFHTSWITIPCLIIIGREIMISALREWMAQLGKSKNITVNMVGKIKTAMQMLSIFMLFLALNKNPYWIYATGIMALYVASILTLTSMVVYLVSSLKTLTNN